MKKDLSLFQQVPLLAGIPIDALELLVASSRVRRYEKNAVVISMGDESSGFYIILQGAAQVYVDDNEGHQIILNNLGTGDYFGELSILSDEPRSANVKTTEVSHLAVINRDNFEQLLKKDFTITVGIIRNLVERVQRLTQNLSSLAFQDVYSRLVQYVMENSTQIDGQRLTSKATHQEIANSIGSSREMVSRILSDLKSGGYISTQSKQIIILKKLPEGW